jgi:hypothetical protein
MVLSEWWIHSAHYSASSSYCRSNIQVEHTKIWKTTYQWYYAQQPKLLNLGALGQKGLKPNYYYTLCWSSVQVWQHSFCLQFNYNPSPIFFPNYVNNLSFLTSALLPLTSVRFVVLWWHRQKPHFGLCDVTDNNHTLGCLYNSISYVHYFQ